MSNYREPRQERIRKMDQKDGVEIFIGRLKNRPNPTGIPNPELGRPIVSAVSTYGAMSEAVTSTGYTGMAMMSLEGLLRPVSLSGEGGLPPYARYGILNSNSNNRNRSSSSFPPVIHGPNATGGTGQYNLEVSQYYLNPLINPVGNNYTLINATGRYASGTGGHDFEILAQRTGLPADQSLITCIGKGSGESHVDTYSDDYRFLALRGPLILQGWGYDTDGKPIPNEIDRFEACVSGVFASGNLRDKFMPDFMQKSKAWPVGPVDLRWDRRRGVWTTPPESQKLRARLTSHVKNGAGTSSQSSGTAIIIGPRYKDRNYNTTLGYNSNGTNLVANSNTHAIVYDSINRWHLSGSEVIIRWDTAQERFLIEQDEACDVVRFMARKQNSFTGFFDYFASKNILCSGTGSQRMTAYITLNEGNRNDVSNDATINNVPCVLNLTECEARPFGGSFAGTALLGGFSGNLPILNVLQFSNEYYNNRILQNADGDVCAAHPPKKVFYRVTSRITGDWYSCHVDTDPYFGVLSDTMDGKLNGDAFLGGQCAIYKPDYFAPTGFGNIKSEGIAEIWAEAFTEANMPYHSGLPTYRAVSPVSLGFRNVGRVATTGFGGALNWSNGVSQTGFLNPYFDLYGISGTTDNASIGGTSLKNTFSVSQRDYVSLLTHNTGTSSNKKYAWEYPELAFDTSGFNMYTDSDERVVHIRPNLSFETHAAPTFPYGINTGIPGDGGTNGDRVFTVSANRGLEIFTSGGTAYINVSNQRTLLDSSTRTQVSTVTGIKVIKSTGGQVTDVVVYGVGLIFSSYEGLFLGTNVTPFQYTATEWP